MAILDPIYATPLAVRLIPNVDRDFAEKLGLRPEQRSIGLITADNDDATYVAIDEATKMADVEVAYARSFYAGARHASGLLSGEIMAILAGSNPAEVRAGLHAALEYMKHAAIWYSANADASIAFFPHLISRTGSFSVEGVRHPARLAHRLPGGAADGGAGGARRRAQGRGRAHRRADAAAVGDQLHGRHAHRRSTGVQSRGDGLSGRRADVASDPIKF
jgi:ethanolamine utilization microcompartment shell protein EutS